MAWRDELPATGAKPYHEQMRDAADTWEGDVNSKVTGKQDAADLDTDVAANVANGASATGSAVTAQIGALAQPLDSDLTAIAALSTTAFGRSLLTLADAAAGRAALQVGRTIEGSGIPEGSVTAPFGTRYIDTAKTRGAREWIKDTGTGTTGWVVTVGDTGWRDISSLLGNGWTADILRVRCTEQGVVFDVSGLDGSASTSINVVAANIPLGWRSGVSTFHPVGALSDGLTAASGGIWGLLGGAAGNVLRADQSVTDGHGQIGPFKSADGWPTTLIGTAA